MILDDPRTAASLQIHFKNTQAHSHPYTHRTTPCLPQFSSLWLSLWTSLLLSSSDPVISSLASFLRPLCPLCPLKGGQLWTTKIGEWKGTFILLEKEPYLSLWGRSINSIWLLQCMHLYVVQSWTLSMVQAALKKSRRPFFVFFLLRKHGHNRLPKCRGTTTQTELLPHTI